MKKYIIALGITLVIIFAALLILPSFLDWDRFKPRIEREVSAALGREIVIDGPIQFQIVPAPRLSVGDVRIAGGEKFSGTPLFQLDRLDVAVAIEPLLSGEIEVENITLVGPHVTLEKNKTGDANWQFTKAGSATPVEAGAEDDTPAGDTPPIRITELRIVDGDVSYRDLSADQEFMLTDLDATLSLDSLVGPMKLDGTADIAGKKVLVGMSLGRLEDGAPTPIEASLGVGEDADVTFSGRFSTGDEV
ncbi:MAG: AsmA family protein, partial [Pseudomonadota bacterium]